MKLEYKGAYRNHGQHVIHNSDELRQAGPNSWPATNKNSVIIANSSIGVSVRFDGSANLNRNADYEFTLSLSNQDLLDIFKMRFGLEVTVLDVQKELFGELVKQRDAAGLPAVRVPLLPLRNG